MPSILKCLETGEWPLGQYGSALSVFGIRRDSSLCVINGCLLFGHRTCGDSTSSSETSVGDVTRGTSGLHQNEDASKKFRVLEQPRKRH